MDSLSETLKALAEETRLNIIRLLLTHDYCVGALAIRLNISEAAVSQHLQILQKAGLTKREKRSYWTHYSVNTDKLRQLADKIQSMADQKFDPDSLIRKDRDKGPDEREAAAK